MQQEQEKYCFQMKKKPIRSTLTLVRYSFVISHKVSVSVSKQAKYFKYKAKLTVIPKR